MARQSFLARLIPLRFRRSVPVIHHVRLAGAIGVGTPLRPAITLRDTERLLERAFSRKGLAGVAISINSPGGSPVQSAMIHRRIRALAEKNRVTVTVFCEDVAASGGYWLACAGDEIYADESSIVGSIGVISAGFGFVEALGKAGIERRVHTAGESKAILDPFQPEKPEDVARLSALQSEIHAAFKDLVRGRRKGKLRADEAELFSGAFWSGKRAVELGLVDGLGHLNDILERKFGDRVVIRNIAPAQGWGRRWFRPASALESLPASALEALETRALWHRFGL
jgi:signal peptide peptidase SppA